MSTDCQSQEQDRLDAESVRRVRGGEPDAFADIVLRYTSLLYALSFRMLDADEEESKEAVQEIFAKLYRYLPRFDAEKRFFSWMYTVALNHLRSEQRRRRVRKRASLPFGGAATRFLTDPAMAPDERAVSAEGERIVHEALARLGRRQREVFVLCEVEELSAREAAEILGISESAVRTRLFRARAALRKMIIDGRSA
ncbi:MAG TPA: sigma-70 family RNA polymerase sigma factor [Spirochaetia bacterium]|nr:sigma-70 family RNA polymerase sigma factor [Spirochaetia bacterium]